MPIPIPDSSTSSPPPIACEVSPTVVQGYRSLCKGVLIFTEDFKKPNIKSLTSWDPEIMFPQEPVSYQKISVTDTVKELIRVFQSWYLLTRGKL